MSQDDTPPAPDDDPVAELRMRAPNCSSVDWQRPNSEARARVLRAELKVEAVRAGIVDLDGLKLLDLKRRGT